MLSPCPLQVRKHINDLYEDLRDGHNLISLLEVLSGVKLVSARAARPRSAPPVRPPAPAQQSAVISSAIVLFPNICPFVIYFIHFHSNPRSSGWFPGHHQSV